ncbi:MAG: DUF3459 domain-containing protein [Halofilum sp. (in: g-proteobacteria)]|nr:DUF3459 domain-containing protein [Halofilum sp. (in: g-proteobacteria)]
MDWTLGDGNRLRLRANLGPAETEFPEPLRGRPLHACGPVSAHRRAGLGAGGAMAAGEGFIGEEWRRMSSSTCRRP